MQASATGLAIGIGGALRDGVSYIATHGLLGPAVTGPAIGYSTVYYIEIVLLFLTLIAIGPLVRKPRDERRQPSAGGPGKFGLAEFPG